MLFMHGCVLGDRAPRGVHAHGGVVLAAMRCGAMRRDATRRDAMQGVAEAFKLPATITSASTQLRKAYSTLLWDYEQVRRRAWHGSGGVGECGMMPVLLPHPPYNPMQPIHTLQAAWKLLRRCMQVYFHRRAGIVRVLPPSKCPLLGLAAARLNPRQACMHACSAAQVQR